MKSFASRSSFHIPTIFAVMKAVIALASLKRYIKWIVSPQHPRTTDTSLNAMSCKAAYVTLLTKTSYLPGVLVLDHCLRSVGSQYPLVVMTTPTLPKSARITLQRRGILVREVGWLLPRYSAQLVDARFEETWTKLR